MPATTREVLFPKPISDPIHTGLVKTEGVIVIVGANGTGKSRLGSWIEDARADAMRTLRVSAQRSLTIPEQTSSTALDVAEDMLWYGNRQQDFGSTPSTQRRQYGRWNRRPTTGLLNDYELLLVVLFSEHNQRAGEFLAQAKQSPGAIPPTTKLERVKQIWEAVLPHRELVIGANKIEAKLRGAQALYNATEMSDGERVVLYLIGECLCAPVDGLVLIDEPEVHIHRSIQARLWNAIEAARPDCTFVYITHDLEFAATRVNATKICLRSYDGSNWDWYEVPADDTIPESVLLEIIGSRKPILFVEGDKTSLDQFIYAKVYPQFSIVSCGGCETVIHATASFERMKHIHTLNCRGLVDRDARNTDAVSHLQEHGVFVLSVSETENLFLMEPILQKVSQELKHTDTAQRIETAQNVVFERVQKERERLASTSVAAQIEASFRDFNAKAAGETALAQAQANVTTAVNIPAAYSAALSDIDAVISKRDYLAALEIYDNKGLVMEIARVFDLTPKGLVEYVKRWLDEEDNAAIVSAFAACMPTIPV